MNPWNLTKREAEILAALVDNGGCVKGVCASLGIARQTVSTMAHRAMSRMQARTRIEALLKFDRWARAQA